jgi:hypothetical protein
MQLREHNSHHPIGTFVIAVLSDVPTLFLIDAEVATHFVWLEHVFEKLIAEPHPRFRKAVPLLSKSALVGTSRIIDEYPYSQRQDCSIAPICNDE